MTVKGVTAAKGKTKKTTEKMSPVCKQAKLHSLRSLTPRPPRLCQVPTPPLHVILKEVMDSCPPPLYRTILSPCSLCNSEEGNGSYPAAWHCGNQCPPKLWRQNSFKSGQKA